MGLIKTSATLGIVYLLADKGLKAYKQRENSKRQSHRDEAPQQGPCSSFKPHWCSYSVPQSICEHQVWCNGRCGGQCNSNGFQNRQQPQDGPLTEGPRSAGMKQITAGGDGHDIDSLPTYEQEKRV